MKKSLRLIMLAIMSLVILNVSATERLTAVLQHNGTPRAFYGENALVEAVEAAEPGDLISLSRGTFKLPSNYNLKKALKIQGIGINTTIEGTITLEIPADQSPTDLTLMDQPRLYLEGLSLSLNNNGFLSNAIIKHCDLKNINVNGTINEFEISQCNINEIKGSAQNSTNFYIHNCIIKYEALGCDAIVDRCVIHNVSRWQGSTIYGGRHTIKNSIIRGNVSNEPGMRYINVLYSDNKEISDAIFQENFIRLSGEELNALFKAGTNELTDEAAARYEFFGSQIGAYGGSTPYTLIPSIPQITSAAVPSTVSADGQLQISFTVEAHD